jgi:hypothetical protein
MQPIPVAVTFTDDSFAVELSDGQHLVAPLDISPKLLEATPEQRARVRMTQSGLHWDELDEDIGISGLLRADFARELKTIRDTMPMTRTVRRAKL